MVCRVFTTHEQLAVSEEREAELAIAVQEAKQNAAAAQEALAAKQAVTGHQVNTRSSAQVTRSHCITGMACSPCKMSTQCCINCNIGCNLSCYYAEIPAQC